MSPNPNIYGNDWERAVDKPPFGVQAASLGKAAGATHLGAGLYEIAPGRANLPYHAHYGNEELIVVIKGTPSLRTPAGTRQLAEGEVVSCPMGHPGAHRLDNTTAQPARVLIVSTKHHADVIDYPDSKKVAAQSGEWGHPDSLGYMFSTEHQAGYFDGETDAP